MSNASANGVAPSGKVNRVLHDRHRTELHDSGLTDATIKEAGIYTETDRGKLATYAGYKRWPAKYGPALVIPFLDEDGERVTVRLKPASPPKERSSDKLRKYIGKRGEPNHAYIPPGAWDAINDPDARLLITEGEKKSLSATQHGFACIGATGVDSWHRKQSFELLPELERIKWKGRQVYVAFDSDAADNPNVLRAERQLCGALESRGATVQVIRLVAVEGEKVGLDDFLVANGPGKLERLIQQAIEPDPPEPGEEKRHVKQMDPSIEAGQILKENEYSGVSRLRYRQGEFWWWRDGRYSQMPNEEVRAHVVAAMDYKWTGVTTSHVSNVMEHLRSRAFLSTNIESPGWIDMPLAGFNADECLATKNEVIHLPSLVSKQDIYSTPATPSFFTYNACDFELSKDARRPEAWVGFLESLWSEDPQSIDALQEMFGYLLTSDTRQQKIFMLIGPKRSGKGTIARVLRELVGRGNVAAPTLSSLSTNFGMSPLIGSSVAIISDARLSGRADQAVVVERLLSISGEDAQTIDRKYLSAITCKLPTRFVILSNELPRFSDASGAVVSRFIMLNTTRSFYGVEDHNLTDKLLAELPGILLWAIEGWRRLHERGRLVQPDSGLESLSEMSDLASPVAAFVGDWCDLGPSEVVVVSELFGAWGLWCRQQGRDRFIGTAASFGKDLSAAVPTVRRGRPRDGEDRQRVYKGIGIKPGNLVQWST